MTMFNTLQIPYSTVMFRIFLLIIEVRKNTGGGHVPFADKDDGEKVRKTDLQGQL
jgi:hypothetical protein